MKGHINAFKVCCICKGALVEQKHKTQGGGMMGGVFLF